MTEVSSIDDLLLGNAAPSIPETPEHATISAQQPNDYESQDNDFEQEAPANDPSDEPVDSVEAAKEYDDYGNSKEKARMYTEEEVSERINKVVRDRLARMKTQDQAMPTVGQVQQAQDFSYNPDSDQGWQQQLESFVEQTFTKINQRQVSQAQQQREALAHNAFQEKFANGMDRFNDFKEVVGVQPITDPMALALRGVNDPAAFVYAASKRHPAELQRISQLADPYAQMVEMGKLEERMRKTKSATNAPKPVGRSREDTGMPPSKKQEGDSIEDLIARADAKRRAQLTARRGRG